MSKRTPAENRQIVNDYLKDMLTTLRGHFARRLKEQREENPDIPLPCDTCAFRTNTDHMEGFDRTTLGFLASLANQDRGGFFACHLPEKLGNGAYAPRPRIENGELAGFEPCAAFSVLTAEPPLDVRKVFSPELVDGLVGTFLGCKRPEWAGPEETDG